MPASITYGPDNRLYVGQLDGSIVAFQQPLLGSIKPEYIVEPGTFEQILGLTFNKNESSEDIILYVSHSRLHTKTEDPPFQGKISKIKGLSFVNFCKRDLIETVILHYLQVKKVRTTLIANLFLLMDMD